MQNAYWVNYFSKTMQNAKQLTFFVLGLPRFFFLLFLAVELISLLSGEFFGTFFGDD